MSKGSRERKEQIKHAAEMAKAAEGVEQIFHELDAKIKEEQLEQGDVQPEQAEASNEVNAQPESPVAAATATPSPEALAPAAKLEELGGTLPSAPTKPLNKFGRPDRWPDRKKRSEISSPVKAVWHIADRMTNENPDVRRRDVVAECIKQGIAGYTARTQYQQWLNARRESLRAAAEAQAKQTQTA